jgi:hypothetical protein
VLSPARRRELGAFYTPVEVAERLVALALDGSAGALTVCDPACGDGVFLLAAGRVLAERGIARATIARDLLWGCDLDVEAVDAAREAIVHWSGVDPGEHLVVADGLTIGSRWPVPFDVVVGNPPFLNQLERATTRRKPLPPRLAEYARPYTDTAWLFLVAASDLAREGGRVVLVQPQSLLAARDAAPVRARFADRLAGLWWCDDALFDASVRVCAPVLGRSTHRVQRWSGREVRAVDDAPRPTGSTWGSLLATEVPCVDLTDGHGTLADLTGATAGFRDEFYGLAAHIRDEPDGDRPLLVTSGLIDVGGIAWGERVTRFNGARYLHPRVDCDGIDGALGRWVRDRLHPKVVLATQTKVLEAAVDVAGTWVPSTPVIALHPHRPDDLWRIAAVLLAPAVSAWAARSYAGAALAPTAIKLSARQAVGIPLPAVEARWSAAADLLKAGNIEAAALAMGDAYGVGSDVHAWWRAKWLGGKGAVGHH